MKVAFINELFPPFTSGGGEWSTLYLANNLTKKGIDVVVITPNYGASSEEKNEGVSVKRYPIYIKLNKTSGNFTYTNPLWIVWSAFWFFKILFKEKVDVIHIQGKYSILPIIIANFFLRKPTVATIRDYICVCNYGICLMNSSKACNLSEYFLKDFPTYFKIYVKKKNVSSFLINLLFAIYGRFSTKLVKYSVNKVDHLTSMSFAEKKILEENGINRPIKVIRNSFEFPKKISTEKSTESVLFVGRLTYGKGLELLISAAEKLHVRYPKLKFLFAGSGPYSQVLTSKRKEFLKYLGQVPHERLISYYKKAKLVVVPSIWPEPFARVTIEALSYGIPVVVTKAGGLPEFIKDDQYGFVSQKNAEDLERNIAKGLDRNLEIRKNILKDYQEIKKLFTGNIVDAHIKLYTSLRK